MVFAVGAPALPHLKRLSLRRSSSGHGVFHRLSTRRGALSGLCNASTRPRRSRSAKSPRATSLHTRPDGATDNPPAATAGRRAIIVYRGLLLLTHSRRMLGLVGDGHGPRSHQRNEEALSASELAPIKRRWSTASARRSLLSDQCENAIGKTDAMTEELQDEREKLFAEEFAELERGTPD
jgi:hypothetical protein